MTPSWRMPSRVQSRDLVHRACESQLELPDKRAVKRHCAELPRPVSPLLKGLISRLGGVPTPPGPSRPLAIGFPSGNSNGGIMVRHVSRLDGAVAAIMTRGIFLVFIHRACESQLEPTDKRGWSVTALSMPRPVSPLLKGLISRLGGIPQRPDGIFTPRGHHRQARWWVFDTAVLLRWTAPSGTAKVPALGTEQSPTMLVDLGLCS